MYLIILKWKYVLFNWRNLKYLHLNFQVPFPSILRVVWNPPNPDIALLDIKYKLFSHEYKIYHKNP